MDTTPLVGRTLAGYELESLLGEGGMAAVYLAVDRKHGRRVALKVLHSETAATIGQDRFLREIETAARLNHPHIVPLHDSGAADGRLFYVMPHVSGGTLRDRLETEKQLSLEEAIRIAREVASALEHAHGQGIVHRDIKPENILLADGIALVADFGLVRALGLSGDSLAHDAETRADLTGRNVRLGTPRYMAPEQASGGEIGPRTDLYALGCVLYEMLAGVPPFTASSNEALMRMHVSSNPRPITEHRASVPPAVADVLDAALAKEPADRPPSASRFAEMLAMSRASGRTPAPATELRDRATKHNLPRQRTRFIGRERELADCARLLGETRLLTLTGVGGSGKTRLALRLAESLLEGHYDGVWVVDLAPVESADLVVQVVANAIRVKDAPDTEITDLIVNHLENRRALLLLDNCEHLLDAVTELCDRLLARLPELALLLTSREGLGLEGERLFAVRSLAIPDTHETDADAIASADSVRLFESRARSVKEDFKLTPESAPIIAEICRRLDGIPLAIELAAARVKVLSANQIRSMLDERFRLLTGGLRGSVERHRTLRATVQWSFDLLEPDEQSVFVVFSVFAGGWTLPAAAAITEKDTFDVLESITRLTDKSLVSSEAQGSGETRYHMLETLRQFGLEILAASGDVDRIRERHLNYFLDLAEERDPQDAVESRFDVGQWFVSEVENFRLALVWGFDREPRKGARLAVSLWSIWLSAGFYREGRRWLTQALEAVERSDPPLAAEARFRLARVVSRQGEFGVSLGHYAAAIEFYRGVGNLRRVLITTRHIGGLHMYMGNLEEARQDLTQAARLAEELGDAVEAGRVFNSQGLLELLEKNHETACDLFQRCSKVFVENEQSDEYQMAIGNLCIALVALDRPQEAREGLRETIAINRKAMNLYGIAHDLPALAEVFRLEKDLVTSARILGANRRLLQEIDAALEEVERQLYDRVELNLRATMGEEAFEREGREGWKLSWREIIELA